MDFSPIRDQILKLAHPQCILLFGSQAKGTARPDSDIDLCVVAHADNKRKLLTELYFGVDAERPIDFLLYTPDEWEECLRDKYSFAYMINREGVRLFG